MPCLPPKYSDVRKAVAHLLKPASRKGILFRAEKLAELLNVAIDGSVSDEIPIRFDAGMLVDAFTKNAEMEYPLVYEHMGYAGDESVLYVRFSQQLQGAGKRKTYIGHFSSYAEGQAASAVEALPDLDLLPQSKVLELVTFLRKKSQQPKGRKGKKRPITPTPTDNEVSRMQKKQCSTAELQTQLEGELKRIEAMKDALATAIKHAAATKAKLVESREDAIEDEQLDKSSTREVPDISTNNYEGGADEVLCIYQGRASKVPMSSHGIISRSDIVANELPLPHTENSDTRRRRQAKGYRVQVAGPCQLWVPVGSTSYPNQTISMWRNYKSIIQRLKKLFGGKRCRFGEVSMRMITASLLHNSGGSDEGGAMAIAATIFAICHKIGLDISPEALGMASPSTTFLQDWEKRFAGECFIAKCIELKEDGSPLFVATDHGHRKGQDSLVKDGSWAGRDENKKRVVKHMCIDMDKCGHTTQAAVAGIAKSLDKIKKIHPTVQMGGISGDDGGGGAVSCIHPDLVSAGAMDAWTRFINCLMHALNKCLERASKATFGKQGLNEKSCWQLIFSIVKMYKRVKEEGTIALADEIQARVVQQMVDDTGVQEELAKNCVKALDNVLDKINSDDIEAVLEEYKIPRNMQEPVWTRWKSSLTAARMVIRNWAVILRFAVAIKQTKKVSSCLSQIACDVLALMNTKSAKPKNGKRGSYPIFYCQLCFVIGFADSYFDNAFEMAMRADPEFGRSSHGHTARFCVEGCYIRKMQLDELMSTDSPNSWTRRSEFQEYRKAVKDMPELGSILLGGKEFFDNVPVCFFGEYASAFVKQIENHWRSDKMLVYIVGGHPTLCRMFLGWLATAEDGGDMEDYIFPRAMIELKHHDVQNNTVTIDTQKCMDYLTKVADPQKILADPIISKNKDLWWKMASAEKTVDLFDTATWDGEDYSKLVDLVHNWIVPHLAQSQRVESYVQNHANVARTNVKEVRRSARGTLHSAIMRPFNYQSREAKREKATNKSKGEKENIKRVKDKERVAGFTSFVTKINQQVERAVATVGNEVYTSVLQDMQTDKDKTSAKELSQAITSYQQGLKKKRKITKSEMNSDGITVTAQMSGKILLSTILKEYDAHLLAEITERGIEPPMPLADMAWQEKKNLLKLDEFKLLSEKGTLQNTPKWEDVKEIEPQSEKLKELFEVQRDKLLKKQTKHKKT